MSASLLWKNSEEQSTFLLQGPGPILLGRGKQCAIHIDDSKISREHCVFVQLDDRWQVKDLGSTNGTRVNGDPVSTRVLADGDELTVGRARFVFRHRAALGIVGAESTRPASLIKPLDADARAVLINRRYELTDTIHHGSTGTFLRARDTKRGGWVCIKLLAARVVANDAELRRFVRGVRTAGQLEHPNIVRLDRAGHSRSLDQWWLAMEWVDGPSLRQVIAKYGVGNMLSPARVLSIARDITAALEAAFERQILHRNIRPENILLTRTGSAKLGDFALTRGVVLTTLQRITGSSELVGDLAYMAPERTEPDGMVDCRSDIYALGVCLYTLLAGRPPFTGRGAVELLERLRHDEPRPPSRFQLAVPGPLEGVVLKCLAKSPEARYQNPIELGAELARVAKFQHGWA